MGRKVWIVAFCVIFSLGTVMLVGFPVRDRMILRKQQHREVLCYREHIARAEGEWLDYHRALARWYNLTLGENPGSEELSQLYGHIGALESGVMGWLEVQEMNWVVPVYHGGSGTDIGAWHDPESAFPLGIRGDRCVITLTRGDILSWLEPGTEVAVGFLGEHLTLWVLPSGKAGLLVLRSEESGLEVHCGLWNGTLSGEQEGENGCWLYGALGAWGTAGAAGILGRAGKILKKRGGKNPNDTRKPLRKAKNTVFS